MPTEPETASTSTEPQQLCFVQLTGLYKALIKLTSQFEKRDVSAAHIEQTETLAETFIESLISHPAPVLAQLQFNKPGLGYFHNFQFNCVLFSALLLLRNNTNLTTAQQILAGVISWCITARPEIEKCSNPKYQPEHCNFEKVKNQLLRALDHYQRQIWRAVVTSASAKSVAATPKLVQQRNVACPSGDYLKLALFMASAITRKPGQAALNFSKALLKLTQQCHCFALPLLEPLMQYPGTLLPGSNIVVGNNLSALYLGRHQSEIYCMVWSASDKKFSDEITVFSESQIKRVASPGNLKNLKLMDHWWGPQWQELQQLNKLTDSQSLYRRGFRLDRPPESLVSVIEHLNAQDIDIDKLISLIETEPSFADHLQFTASQQSRAKLKVSTVKHGLLMNGFERTQSVLVEKALTGRLTQHSFPLQDVIYQFVKLWALIAAEIAQRHPKLLPEQASCWVYFAASGLFTHAELKLKQHWQYLDDAATKDSHKISMKQPQLLWQHAYKLACSWAQDKAIRDALRDVQAKQALPATSKRSVTHTLLNVSLALASSLYFKGNWPALESDDFLLHYCQRLGLDNALISEIQQETVKNSHNYWPIYNKCTFENG